MKKITTVLKTVALLSVVAGFGIVGAQAADNAAACKSCCKTSCSSCAKCADGKCADCCKSCCK